jgi:hypothetical protein
LCASDVCFRRFNVALGDDAVLEKIPLSRQGSLCEIEIRRGAPSVRLCLTKVRRRDDRERIMRANRVSDVDDHAIHAPGER